MEMFEWISRNKTSWATSILRVAYYLTTILTVLMFITPFYSLFVYFWPHAAHLLTGSASIYVAIIAIIYGISFLILTAVLIVLHGIAEELLGSSHAVDHSNS